MLNSDRINKKSVKGKSKEEKLANIKELKQKMNHLKSRIEESRDEKKSIRFAWENMKIQQIRKRLKQEKKAYEEAGGIYILSQSERRTAYFEDNIMEICKMTFEEKGYFFGQETYIIDLTEGIKCTRESLYGCDRAVKVTELEHLESYTKESFIEELKGLYIGEWSESYSDINICDGTTWELEFEYGNGSKSVKFEGMNAEPYNFHKVKRLLGIDETEED